MRIRGGSAKRGDGKSQSLLHVMQGGVEGEGVTEDQDKREGGAKSQIEQFNDFAIYATWKKYRKERVDIGGWEES